MTAFAGATSGEHVSSPTSPAFETLLPSIERFAAHAFRNVRTARREELVADVITIAYVAFRRLVGRGLVSLVYPTALAKFAVRQVRNGRQVGCSQNVRDAMSALAQRKHGFSVLPLPPHAAPGDWEALVEDRRANPADIAACRIDFRDWLARLKRFKRQVALQLAAGATTGDAARHFRLSLARVSQLRQELRADWDAFQGMTAAA